MALTCARGHAGPTAQAEPQLHHSRGLTQAEPSGPAEQDEFVESTEVGALAPASAVAASTVSASSEADLERRFLSWQAAELDGAAATSGGATRPVSGWRRMVLALSRGLYNPGLSSREVLRLQQTADLCTPLRRNRHVAVVSMAGGVGKTVTAGFLGQAWGEARGDRVCAIDANPDAGNLAERFGGPTSLGPDGRSLHPLATVRDLLDADADADIGSVADMAKYMTVAGRLHILAAPAAVADALSAAEYQRVQTIVDRFYNLTIIDTGTSIAHESHRAILELADDLVFVVGPSMDASRRVKAMMDDLQARGYGDLLARATVIIVTRSKSESSLSRHRRGGGVDANTLASYFHRRVREVVNVPYSRALSDGVTADFAALSDDVRDPYLQAAAGIAAHFNGSRAASPLISHHQRVPRVTSVGSSSRAARRRLWLRGRTAARPAAGKTAPVFDAGEVAHLEDLPRYGRRADYLPDRP